VRTPRFRRATSGIAAAVSIAALALFFLAPPFLATFEARLYDLHFALRGVRDPGRAVAIVAIDERSLAEVGRWPWPRTVLADLVDRATAAGARVIALDILLSEPEVSGELRAVRALQARLGAVGPPESPARRVVERELEALAEASDADARLAAAIRASGRVVLPVAFETAPETGRAAPPAPDPVGPALPSALVSFRNYEERGRYPPPGASRAVAPLPALAAAARELGHVTMVPDADGTTRLEAAVFEFRGRYYPSLAVQAVRVARGVDAPALRLDFGRALEIGDLVAPLDARNRMLIDYAGPAGTFPHVSAVDLLRGRAPADALRDRIVFVGATAEGTYDLRVTPVSAVFPGVEKHANVAANLLEGRFLRQPDWATLLEALSVLLAPFTLAWALPRVRPLAGLGLTVLALGALVGATHLAFRAGLWLPIFHPILSAATALVAITGFLYVAEERKRLGIKRAFQRFVSPDVVEQIAEHPEALQFGGENRQLTVLFSDIRDFTSFTERHAPQEMVQMLREYFTRMVETVHANQGTLDKFIGDAVMAIFGAPLAYENHAERACRAALAMLDALEALQARWTAEGREVFRIGIGINSGEMVVGNLGSEQVFNYTVVGDGVNLASRLESLTKEFGVPIVISESTYTAVQHVLAGRFLGEVRVKGKAAAVKVYALERQRGARSARVAVSGRVEVQEDDLTVPAAIANLSRTGVAVQMLERALTTGREVQLRFPPDDGHRGFSLAARVVWTQPGRAGLRFLEVPADAAAALEARVGDPPARPAGTSGPAGPANAGAIDGGGIGIGTDRRTGEGGTR